MSTCLYKKVGKKKYEYWGEHDHLMDIKLPEGLWIVYKTQHSHGIEHVRLRDDEAIVPADILDRHTLKQRILKVMLDNIDQYISPNELAKRIALDLIPTKPKVKSKPKLRMRGNNG